MTPPNDAFVLERLPEAHEPGQHILRALHAELRTMPDDMPLAILVARTEMIDCRRLFDPRPCGRAEAALGPWINLANPPADVLLLRGILRQSDHLFDQSLADFARVLAERPNNAQALVSRAVVHEVRAEYALARIDCGAAAYHVGNAAQVACLAGASSLTGHAAVTLAALKTVDSDPSSPAEERLWALTVEGEVAARLGRNHDAEDAFIRARKIEPDDSYLLGAYADLLLDEGRLRQVTGLLTNSTRIEVLLLRLNEAEARLGEPSSKHISALAQSFETSRRRGDIIHQREQARFELHVLHQPVSALATAIANWKVQREPADAAILMEAALAAHQPKAAQPALDWFRDNHVEDVLIAPLALRLGAAS